MKYIKTLLIIKTVEIQNKNKIMSSIPLSNSYKKTIQDLIYRRY